MTEIHLHDKIKGTLQKIYVSERKPEHYMRIFQGFGVSQTVLDVLKEENVIGIIIDYHGETTRKKLFTPLNQWFESEKKRVHNGYSSNYEDDLQIFISERDMILLSEEKK